MSWPKSLVLATAYVLGALFIILVLAWVTWITHGLFLLIGVVLLFIFGIASMMRDGSW